MEGFERVHKSVLGNLKPCCFFVLEEGTETKERSADAACIDVIGGQLETVLHCVVLIVTWFK